MTLSSATGIIYIKYEKHVFAFSVVRDNVKILVFAFSVFRDNVNILDFAFSVLHDNVNILVFAFSVFRDNGKYQVHLAYPVVLSCFHRRH